MKKKVIYPLTTYEEQSFNDWSCGRKHRRTSPYTPYWIYRTGCLLIDGASIGKEIHELDKRFIDTQEVEGTLFGISFINIKEILDWFVIQEYHPENWNEFKKELQRRKIQ